jgi:hypothetical protein
MASALEKLKGVAAPFPVKGHYEANYFLFTIVVFCQEIPDVNMLKQLSLENKGENK